MKRTLVFAMLLTVSLASQAQCNENITGQKMQKGMYIYTYPVSAEDKKYVAEILSVDATGFSCRFLHSNTVYQFNDFRRSDDGPATRMQATVRSSRGGAFQTGTVFKMNVFMADPEPCDLAKTEEGSFYDIIATFAADNKTYLARIGMEGEKYMIRFAHSNADYTTDKNFKVLAVKGGGYKVGSQIKVKHARILQF